MNATDFFTRRILGMDYGVWGAMLLVCLLSIGLYGYRQVSFNTRNDQPCSLDTITVNGKTADIVAGCYLNRISTFELQSETAATVEWDFRDGTNELQGQVVSHQFIEEGTYRITATVNGRCRYDAVVEVVEDPFLPGGPEKQAIEVFADPMRPATGSSVKFYCVADLPTIASYEWKVVSTNEVNKEAVPAFTFRHAGFYTVQLVINNDPSTKTTRVIEVTEDVLQTPLVPANGLGAGGPGDIGPLGNLIAPGGNAANGAPRLNNGAANDPGAAKADSLKGAAQPKAPEVDPNAFKDLLQNVVDQNGKEMEDLFEYLDYKASTMVEVNENKSLIPLKDFCRNMRGKKKNKRKIESLSFNIDDKKSIQAIRVKIPESKGFWERISPFG